MHDPDGIDEEKLAWVKELKLEKRGRISEYANEFSGAKFVEEGEPWDVEADLAMPCATKNEIDKKKAQKLIDNAVLAIAEGANMPTADDGVGVFHEAAVLYGRGKAAMQAASRCRPSI